MAVTPHDPSESPVPGYALEIYKLLHKSSKPTEEGMRVFTGSLSELYATLGMSKQHYSKIMACLVETGSIAYVQRGNAHQKTIVHVFKEPAYEELLNTLVISKQAAYRRRTDLEIRVEQLENLVSGLNMKEALLNHEKRIKELEANYGN
jgi:hypothetical protein